MSSTLLNPARLTARVYVQHTYSTYLQIPVALGRMISIVSRVEVAYNSQVCGEKKGFQWTDIPTKRCGIPDLSLGVYNMISRWRVVHMYVAVRSYLYHG